jgi:hypothetical protein
VGYACAIDRSEGDIGLDHPLWCAYQSCME